MESYNDLNTIRTPKGTICEMIKSWIDRYNDAISANLPPLHCERLLDESRGMLYALRNITNNADIFYVINIDAKGAEFGYYDGASNWHAIA